MTPRNIQKQQEASYKRHFLLYSRDKKKSNPQPRGKKNTKKKIRRNSALSKKEKKKVFIFTPLANSRHSNDTWERRAVKHVNAPPAGEGHSVTCHGWSRIPIIYLEDRAMPGGFHEWRSGSDTLHSIYGI